MLYMYPCSKNDNFVYVVNKAPGASSFIPIKRKNSMLSSKRKRERADNVDLLGLKVTLEEAQGLFRSPPRHSPCVVIIEDFKFEEYEVHLDSLTLLIYAISPS